MRVMVLEEMIGDLREVLRVVPHLDIIAEVDLLLHFLAFDGAMRGEMLGADRVVKDPVTPIQVVPVL